MKPYLPDTIPKPLRKKLGAVVGSVSHFAQLHKVQDKDTKRPIPLRPLPMQRRIFDAVAAGHKRIAVIKARQVAATTGCKMVLQQLLYSTPHEAMVALVSMRADSAAALLRENKRWLEDLPKPMQRPLRTSTATELVLDDTGASIKAFTTRSKTGLRSFSPIAAVVSEFAYAPDQAEVLKQADAAVGDRGLLIIESTAQNPGDLFSEIVRGAPENGWHLLTMWWHEHPAYTDAGFSPDFERSLADEELQLQAEHGLDLDLGQLYWRRKKVLSIGADSFRQEYPGNLDDCFLRREGAYFDAAVLSQIDVLDFKQLGESSGRQLEPPHPMDRYVMGVDVGGGVGGDYSTLYVVSVATGQPVYAQRSNTLNPREWAHEVGRQALRYNQALVLLESNNHGHAVALELDHIGYRNLWRHPMTGRPWTTTKQSKLDALETLREHLELITRMDRATWLELRSLTIPAGKATPEAPAGSHDDLAMAAALAYRALRDIPPSWRTSALQSTRARADKLLDAARARRLRQRTPTPFG